MSEALTEVKKSWEEYIQEFTNLEETKSNSFWQQVDLLCALVNDFGRSSLTQFAKQVKYKPSTFINYIRAAKGFPPETRIPSLPFETHLQATFADEYKHGEFIGNQRFLVINTAADNEWSARKVRKHLGEEKIKQALQIDTIPCYKCGGNTGEIQEYLFYSPYRMKEAKRWYLHDECFDKYVKLIEKNKI